MNALDPGTQTPSYWRTLPKYCPIWTSCWIFFDTYRFNLSYCFIWCKSGIDYSIYISNFSLSFYLLGLKSSPLGVNLFIIINNPLKFLHLHLILLQFRSELIDDRQEHNINTHYLHPSCCMMIIQDTNKDRQYFAGCYHKWYNVLLELFDHSIHEELAEAAEQWHTHEMDSEHGVIECVHAGWDDGVGEYHWEEWDDGHPFVNLFHHFSRLGFELWFYLGLEIG